MAACKHIVVTVHGIRTFGGWQTRLRRLIERANPAIEVQAFIYGYFSAIAFLIPPLRWLIVRHFRIALERLRTNNPTARIDLVAHSFGTYLVGWALAKTQVPLSAHTVLLAGSVLRADFDWSPLIARAILRRLINDCGIDDFVLALSQLGVLFTGMAGRAGFSGLQSTSLQNRYFRGGHSLYFDGVNADPDYFMKTYWIPIFLSDSGIVSIDERVSPSPVRGIVETLLRNAEPIELTIYLCLFSAPAIYYWHLNVRITEDSKTVTEQSGLLRERQVELLLESARANVELTQNDAAESLLDELVRVPIELRPSIRDSVILLRAELRHRRLPIVRTVLLDALTHKCFDTSPDARRIYVVTTDANGYLTATQDELDDLGTNHTAVGRDKCSLLGRRFSSDGNLLLQLDHVIRIIDVNSRRPVGEFAPKRTYLDAGFGFTRDTILVVYADHLALYNFKTGNIIGDFPHSSESVWSEGGDWHVKTATAQWECGADLLSCRVEFPANKYRDLLAGWNIKAADRFCALPGQDSGGVFGAGHVYIQKDGVLSVYSEECLKDSTARSSPSSECGISWAANSKGMMAAFANGLALTREDGLEARGAITGELVGQVATFPGSEETMIRRQGTGRLIALVGIYCPAGNVTARLIRLPKSSVVLDAFARALGTDPFGIPIILDEQGDFRVGFDMSKAGHISDARLAGHVRAVSRFEDLAAIATNDQFAIVSLSSGALHCRAPLSESIGEKYVNLSFSSSGQYVIYSRFAYPQDGAAAIFNSASCEQVAAIGSQAQWSRDGTSVIHHETLFTNGRGYINVQRTHWSFDPTRRRVANGRRAMADSAAMYDKSTEGLDKRDFSAFGTALSGTIPNGGLMVLPAGTVARLAHREGVGETERPLEATGVIDADSGLLECQVPYAVTGAWRVSDSIIALGREGAVSFVDRKCRALASFQTHSSEVEWVGVDFIHRRVISIDSLRRLQVWTL